MLAVLVAIPTTTENLLHPLSTYSIIVFHPLDFMVQGKITEADAPPVCLDTNCVFPIFTPNALSAAMLPIYPGLGQAPYNAGLHTQWLV